MGLSLGLHYHKKESFVPQRVLIDTTKSLTKTRRLYLYVNGAAVILKSGLIDTLKCVLNNALLNTEQVKEQSNSIKVEVLAGVRGGENLQSQYARGIIINAASVEKYQKIFTYTT